MPPRKNIPTKAELAQLQKLYRTDEKIGERLGGVPAYLVAYWRRKKNVPRHSQPKFSDREIKTLWERFGDDDRCGLELGISKAAFYNWRRRYEIREKPAFLKLEQLELEFPGARLGGQADHLYGEQTVVQKVLARAVGESKVAVGQKIEAEPDSVLVGHGIASVIEQFRKVSADFVWNPSRVIITMDGQLLSDRTDGERPTGKSVRQFVKRQNIKSFHELSRGFTCQVAAESGQVLPGHLCLGTDPHVLALGCVSAVPINISAEKATHVWATGKVTVEVPPTVRIDINGRRSRGVYAKDIGLSIIDKLNDDNLSGRAIEFYGSAISHMSVSERYTLCDMAANLGAMTAYCGFDSATRRYLNGRTVNNYRPVMPDHDAIYENVYQMNIDRTEPCLAGPDNVHQVRPVAELEGTPVRQFVLGTGTNGRFDDLRVGAEILKGKKIPDDCCLVVIPGSRSVYLEALKKGLIRLFIEAGAVLVYPGFEPPLLREEGLIEPGERCLSTSNGLSLGLAHDSSAEVYICSPATVAASALNGAISDPVRYCK